MPTEIWAFFADVERYESADLRARIGDICKERDWRYVQWPAITAKAPNGRTVLFVEPSAAERLYRAIHRSRIGVLALGKIPSVSLHPNAKVAVKFGHHRSLRLYVAHKAFWQQLHLASTNDGWVGVFEKWVSDNHCQGEHDPRCLPFHIFRGHSDDLGTDDGRRAFNDRYGSGARRHDDNEAQWILDPSRFHGGQSPLHVAGYQLRDGYHWDVNARNLRVMTPAGVWMVNVYINVYPDGHVRITGDNARREF